MPQLKKLATFTVIGAAALASVATSMPEYSTIRSLSVSEEISSTFANKYTVDATWLGEDEVKWFGDVSASIDVQTSSTATVSDMPRVRMVIAREDAPRDLITSYLDDGARSAEFDERITAQETTVFDGNNQLFGGLQLFTACKGACSANFSLWIKHLNPETAPAVFAQGRVDTTVYCSGDCEGINMAELDLKFDEVD